MKVCVYYSKWYYLRLSSANEPILRLNFWITLERLSYCSHSKFVELEVPLKTIQGSFKTTHVSVWNFRLFGSYPQKCLFAIFTRYVPVFTSVRVHQFFVRFRPYPFKNATNFFLGETETKRQKHYYSLEDCYDWVHENRIFRDQTDMT